MDIICKYVYIHVCVSVLLIYTIDYLLEEYLHYKPDVSDILPFCNPLF